MDMRDLWLKLMHMVIAAVLEVINCTNIAKYKHHSGSKQRGEMDLPHEHFHHEYMTEVCGKLFEFLLVLTIPISYLIIQLLGRS